ncbi:Na(+)/H(+) exchange regulatory cofactor NHE-RF3 [Conger conger]|uniref:Na(+)/H(+) exchange regulatory cofactor NHE-RF3 n=1 Tax=Conger conger TaxID=82655 RepID=UPI002A59BD75|nr:Na(+)/H(+) exchange regulatory cofactor NHE-RF3 [Conger conger]
MTTYTPRVISLTKREGQSFGFLLRLELVEEGHLIRNLDRGGLAELAGLKDGDRILRVNGIFVDDLDHSLVAGMVRNSGSSVILHVLDKHSYKQSKASGANLSEPQSRPTMNGTARTDPKPKLCFLEKAKSGYGFSLKSKNGEEGIFIFNVTPSGVAEKAGAKTSDRVLEVNSENVEIATHDQIVEKIKAGGNSIMFLLADEETDRHYKNKKIKLGVGLATTKYLPRTPRIVDITKGSDGYGYFLRSYPNLKGHFIKDIDKGSPAEKVGLRDMDRLVAINGDGLDGLTHEQVVERIHQCGDKCCLLVVDAETDKLYKLGGASPLLYWEEMRGPLPQPSPPASPKAMAKPITALPAYDQAPAPAKPSEDNYKPKLCKLEKTSSGFGFHLNGIIGETGQYFIKEVVKGGVADRAGLEDEDIVIEVDGVNVEAHPYGEVVDMIKASGNSLVLLVVDQQAYNYFKAKKIPITTLLLSQDSFDRPHTPASLKEVKEVEEEDKEESDKEEGDKEKSDKEESDKEESDRDKGDKEEESNKDIEKNKEEESNKEEKRDKEGEKEPATLPILTEARERTASASSSSSSLSVDEQL